MKKKEVTYYQQGDVVLVKIPKVSGSKLTSKTIQEGEHTGHAHRIADANSSIYQTTDGARYLKVLRGGSSITHEEHDTTIIEEGDYEVRIVRQKDPFSKLVSKVVD